MRVSGENELVQMEVTDLSGSLTLGTAQPQMRGNGIFMHRIFWVVFDLNLGYVCRRAPSRSGSEQVIHHTFSLQIVQKSLQMLKAGVLACFACGALDALVERERTHMEAEYSLGR